jgi:hypothetical protein
MAGYLGCALFRCSEVAGGVQRTGLDKSHHFFEWFAAARPEFRLALTPFKR